MAPGTAGPIRVGSCSCGAVRFEVTGPLVGINACHCSKCRKETGAHASMFIPVRGSQFRWLAGADAVTEWVRCRTCGSLAPMHNPARDLFNVPVGLLDSHEGVRIAHHIFIGSKAPWDVIGDDAPQYEEDDCPPLLP